MKTFALVILTISTSFFVPQDQLTSKWVSAKSGLRMREAPDLSGKKLESIPYNQKVTVLEVKDKTEYLANTSGSWTKVKWKDQTGWVYGGFLSDRSISNSNVAENVSKEFVDFFESMVGEPPSLARIDVEGYGFITDEDGNIKRGILDENGVIYDGEYNLEIDYHFEKYVTVSVNQGYEWGSTTYRFHDMHFSYEDVFAFAAGLYLEKFSEFLSTRDGIPQLPENEQKFSRTVDSVEKTFTVKMNGRHFESLRIDESEGCGQWWYFKVDGNYFELGSGGGC